MLSLYGGNVLGAEMIVAVLAASMVVHGSGVHRLERSYIMQCSQFNLDLQRRSSLCDRDKTTPALASVLAHKFQSSVQ